MLFSPIQKTGSNHLKVTVQASSKFGILPHATVFVYENENMIYANVVGATGIVVLNLERGKNYKLVVSNPGHVSATAYLSTEKMTADQVRTLYFPIKLYNLRDPNIDYSNVNFKIKWNPIFERFETFQNNLGWIDELREMEDKKEGK